MNVMYCNASIIIIIEDTCHVPTLYAYSYTYLKLKRDIIELTTCLI